MESKQQLKMGEFSERYTLFFFSRYLYCICLWCYIFTGVEVWIFFIWPFWDLTGASLVAQMVKNLPAVQETRVWSLGQMSFLNLFNLISLGTSQLLLLSILPFSWHSLEVLTLFSMALNLPCFYFFASQDYIMDNFSKFISADLSSFRLCLIGC